MEDIRVLVYVCRCGINIAGVIDCPDLVEYSKGLPNVVHAEEYLSLCTSGGAATMKNGIEKYKANRVVVAACTPKTHEPVFRAVLVEAGLNPNYLEFVNIREHVSYVHKDDIEGAKCAARDQVKAGVARASRLEIVPQKTVAINEKVLVIGGGVGGLKAALDLADAGYRVYLVEKEPTIGGKMAMFDRVFPTDDCSIWILGPVMLETARNPNITLFTCSEIEQVSGYIGNFDIQVRRHARYVKESACNGCGTCFSVCPAITGNEFDQGEGFRRAIYVPFAQAVPNKARIDMNACIKCGLCQKACELNAIDFDMKDEIVEVKVGVIVVATGFNEYIPPKGFLGFDEYDNVITQMKLERMLAPNGPLVGHIRRPSDLKRPKSILFIQCVGSRDLQKNSYCSSGVCCLISIKNAKLIKSEYPDSDISIAFMDIRAAGKYYEEYYLAARKEGVKFIQSNVARIKEDPVSKNLKVLMQDIRSEDKAVRLYEYEMVVLSAAMVPSFGVEHLASKLRTEVSADGFFKEYHPRLNTVDTKIPGIVLAGCAQGPKTISEVVMSAKGAASTAAKLLRLGEYTIDLIKAINDPQKCSRCGLCATACPAHAIQITPDGALVDEILCMGCGICAGICPSTAMTLRYYRDEQYDELIDSFFDPIPTGQTSNAKEGN